MTKEQFLFQLEQMLLDIPEDERAEAMEYYRDYFNDAGPENEESVISELGSPEKVAGSIKDGLRGNREDAGTVGEPPMSKYGASQGKFEQTDKRSKWILVILIAIFTAPVWIGLVGTLFGVLMAVVGVLIGIIATVFALTIAGTVGGVVTIVTGVVRLCTGNVVVGIMTGGVGFLLIAMGCICAAALVFLFCQIAPWMIRGISNLMHSGIRKKVRK